VRVPACVCVRAIACACARGGRAHVRREVAELVQGHLGTSVGPPVLPSHRHLRKLALHSKHLSLPPLAQPPPPPRQRERVGAVPRAAHSFLPSD
jgi:hypothetical protein